MLKKRRCTKFGRQGNQDLCTDDDDDDEPILKFD
jgi:hypothetical protein